MMRVKELCSDYVEVVRDEEKGGFYIASSFSKNRYRCKINRVDMVLHYVNIMGKIVDGEYIGKVEDKVKENIMFIFLGREKAKLYRDGDLTKVAKVEGIWGVGKCEKTESIFKMNKLDGGRFIVSSDKTIRSVVVDSKTVGNDVIKCAEAIMSGRCGGQKDGVYTLACKLVGGSAYRNIFKKKREEVLWNL